MKEAVIILGHGSRREEANQEVAQLVSMLRARKPQLEIMAAYAEFAQPALESAIELLVQKGFEYITVVPLFLTVGNHLNQKLPAKIKALSAHYHGTKIVMTKHIGADPLIVQILENRIGS